MTVEQILTKDLHERAAVQEDSQEKLLRQANVRGVALGNRIKGGRKTDEPVITVLVAQKLAPELLADRDRVPRKIKSVPTDVVEVGEIFVGGLAAGPADDRGSGREHAQPRALRRRTRPVMGGCSVGHFRITAGTIATCCYDLEPFPGTPQRYDILSNNHVLANSNDANIGDPILQPGPIDGGRMPDDVVARLSRFVPIRFVAGDSAPYNFVDAAVAEGEFEDLNREVYWIGHVRRLEPAPAIGDIVQKTGRTAHFSTGAVRGVNATVDVNYGGGRVARFCRQIITDNMSAPGDSGSLVTNVDEEGVGLLFAGSSVITVLNHLVFVQSLLRVRITER